MELDQTIQVLKDESVQFNRDAATAEEDFLYPPHSRVTIYVSVETAGLLMKDISIDIDGGEPVIYRYSDLDARALVNSKGLQRLARFNVAKGSHRLRASYTGNLADDGEAPLSDRFEAVFDKSLSPVDLELVVGRPNKRGKPLLRLKEWRPSK